jgi:DNA-binding beta-propeller fold protein YncE
LIFVANHGNVGGRETLGISARFDPPSITVYPLKGQGNVAPLRVIEGSNARLNWPAALYMDEERGELYVANDADDSILVFRSTDTGNATPIRVIRGPKTQLKNPTGLFLDPRNNEIWASNMGNHRATVYDRTANGDVAPKRVIRSAPAEKVALAIGNPGAVGYDSKREEILVPN